MSNNTFDYPHSQANVQSSTVGYTLTPGIFHDIERRLWILTTDTSSYALGVTSENLLMHLYWGPRLFAASDLTPATLPPEHSTHDTAAHLATEEYAPWGGLRYGETTLKASFVDGTRDLDLRFVRVEIQEQATLPTLLVELRDAVYALGVTLCYQLDSTHDLVIRSATVSNSGTDVIVLERAFSALWHLPRQSTPRTLTTLAGQWFGETRIQRQPVVASTVVIESRRGTTGFASYPWFALDTAATADQGEVYFGSLAWSGNWTLHIATSITGATTIAGGIHDYDFSWSLAPGAMLALPDFVAGFSAEGLNGVRQRLHGYTRAHVLPHERAASIRPVLYNSWEATYFDVTEEGQIALAKRAALLGVERFVVDDGWFHQRNSDHAGLGDWFPDAQKFPQGLDALVRSVREQGMQFGLWFEPEMVNPDSDLYRAHPDWVYRFPQRPRSEARNQLVLNMGREDVQAYLLEKINALLDQYAIDFIKWDMNRPISEPGWPEQPERGREIWVRHVQGIYTLMSRLRALHPNLDIEACSAGGGRADLGVLRYTDQIWTSDNTHPDARLPIQEGFSLALPANVMSSWVTDAPGEQFRHQVPLAFRFHTSMLGVLGIGANLLHWSEEEMAEASSWIALYKTLRSIIQSGRQYWLATATHEGDLTAVMYVTADQEDAVVFAFRRSSVFAIPASPLRLQGLKLDRFYHVEHEQLVPRLYSGSSLLGRGLDMPLSMGSYASCIVRLHMDTTR